MSFLKEIKERGFLILFSATTILLLLTFNRMPNLVQILQSPFLKDAVITDFFARSLLEHVFFGFFFTLIFFFFLYGVQKFLNKNSGWKLPIYFGIGATIFASSYWEVFNAKGTVEFLEIAYDLAGAGLAFCYVKFFGDFDK